MSKASSRAKTGTLLLPLIVVEDADMTASFGSILVFTVMSIFVICARAILIYTTGVGKAAICSLSASRPGH